MLGRRFWLKVLFNGNFRLNHNCPGQITEFLMFHVFFILYLYLAEVYSIDVTELLNIATLLYSVPTVL